jgi:hypothetical protein
VVELFVELTMVVGGINLVLTLINIFVMER